MINVLERITELRVQKQWSEYQLAAHSGLTQSTISSWYRKGILPTLPSLEKICSACGITLSQFFDDRTNELSLISPKEKQLLEIISKLNNTQFDALVEFLDKL